MQIDDFVVKQAVSVLDEMRITPLPPDEPIMRITTASWLRMMHALEDIERQWKEHIPMRVLLDK